MIFDVKLGENFRRKARLVGGGHKTFTPDSIAYSLVVSMDLVRIALIIAELNDLGILVYEIHMFRGLIERLTYMFCDNKSVYKNSPTMESVLRKNHHIIAYHMCRKSFAA